MNKEQYNLDEMLECAIREKAAREFLQRVDSRNRTRRRLLLTAGYGIAATLVILISAGLKLSLDTRRAGYGFDPVAGQMGGSEITALMQNRQIGEALVKIDEARDSLAAEIEHPSSSDPDYAAQLESDRQELDLLEAVCAMRQGRYFKARRLLRAIVQDDGIYSEEAQSLLDSL